MGKAMLRIGSDPKPPSMWPNQDEAHTMIGDLTAITVLNSSNDQHLVLIMCTKLDDSMLHIAHVQILRTVSFWMLLHFSSLHFSTSFDLGAVQKESQLLSTTSRVKSTSAKCKSDRKAYANLPATSLALTCASKYFQMLPAPLGLLQGALRLCKSIHRCS